jgi:hypothetical protein
MENSDIASGKMLNTFLASLIAGSGIIAGAVLAILAKEEIKPGMRYFLILKNVLFSAAVVITMCYYSKINLAIALAAPLLFSPMFINKFQIIAMYVSFAIILILSQADSSLYVAASSLIFLAGLPIGTIEYSAAKKKPILNILIPYLVFVLISLISIFFSISS